MEMSRIPASPSGFLELQQQRHQAIFMMSVNRQPGRFRGANSQGSELFLMDHQLVKGTLERGFEYYNALKHPLAKGIYAHFLIIETQPFISGNGLLARTMLNAELVRANQSRVFFPPSSHAEYTMSMRKLSRQQEAIDYVKLMQRLHMFSAGIYGEDLEGIHRTFFNLPGAGA
jgi:Fic family protein